MKVKLALHEELRKRLTSSENKLQLSFNHHGMTVEIPMVLDLA